MTAPDVMAALDEAAGLDNEPPKKENVVRKLADAVRECCTLVHEAGRWYAVPLETAWDAGIHVPPGVAIGRAEMKRIIVRLGRTAKIATVTPSMADTVLLHLEAEAFDGRETPLALRFAHEPGLVVLDLGRNGRSDGAVIIEPGKWAFGGPGRTPFRRSHAIRPLPDPKQQPGVTLASLAGVLALDPDGGTFRCLAGWLIGLAFAGNVRPGMLLTGPPGSAKSTRLRLAASVVEPVPADGLSRAFGRKADDDEVRALHRAVPLYDNVTAVSGAASDLLCTIVTGAAREGRQLYSNDGLSTAPIRRPVGMTAVATPAGLRPDALDRLIICEADPPAVLRGDAMVQAAFDAIHPGLLAAWCDAVAVVLAWLPCVPEPGSYRMAAHAHVLAALDAATAAGYLPGCPGGLLDAYAANVQRVREEAASDDVFGSALLALLNSPAAVARDAQGRPLGFRWWGGTAAELLRAVALYAPPGNPRDLPGWPSTPRAVPNVLGQLAVPLRACGVTWTARSLHGCTRHEFTLRSENQDAA